MKKQQKNSVFTVFIAIIILWFIGILVEKYFSIDFIYSSFVMIIIGLIFTNIYETNVHKSKSLDVKSEKGEQEYDDSGR